MATTYKQRGRLINSLKEVDFSYEGWEPDIKIWRSGEGYKRELPYMAVDFIATNENKFNSMGGDIVERLDDFRYERAYCELELVDITIYTSKYHNSGAIRGRDYAEEIMLRIRKRIFAYWDDLLSDFNASRDRSKAAPIRDLSKFNDNVATRIYEYNLSIFLRTDVRWYKGSDDDPLVEERAEKAYGVLNEETTFRINTS